MAPRRLIMWVLVALLIVSAWAVVIGTRAAFNAGAGAGAAPSYVPVLSNSPCVSAPEPCSPTFTLTPTRSTK